MVASRMLYKMPHFRSSKILGTRVFRRLRNQTLDGHISGLVHHRDKLKPLLPTKLPTPYRLAPVPFMSRDHTTSGLAFLAFRSHMNRRKRPRSWDMPKVGDIGGPVLGVTALPAIYQNLRHCSRARARPVAGRFPISDEGNLRGKGGS